MDQSIVEMDGRPFAYLQCYALTDWNMGFGAQPGGTRGIDLLIGDAGMTGRGHGRAFIRAFADRVLAGGSPRVVTDPDPANERAIHVYEQAGFVKDGMVDTPDGVSLLMVRNA
jgi:aminoglycoside 6'-N-acetyltransferase